MPYCIYLRKSRADAEAELSGEGETLARHEKALLSLAEKVPEAVVMGFFHSTPAILTLRSRLLLIEEHLAS
jgi:hypothetical protein